ncbi:hypothetical protein [Bradyrhizobium sp. B120]|uniref:hypothetical protein n=1 Tax=Bradyrhizobium sp. B120 TaxID=3410088 RepID=UPI003B9870FC
MKLKQKDLRAISRLLGHGEHHGSQRLYVIREVEIGRHHWPDQSAFCPGSLAFQLTDSLGRSAFTQQSPAA